MSIDDATKAIANIGLKLVDDAIEAACAEDKNEAERQALIKAERAIAIERAKRELK